MVRALSYHKDRLLEALTTLSRPEMDKVTLRRYQAILREQLGVLQGHNDGTVGTLEEDTVSHADPNDRATAESNRGFDLRLRDRDRKLIGKIKRALARIEDGSFGVCADCGQPIEEKRLEVRPVTTQCIECKEDQETRENRVKPELSTADAPAKPKSSKSKSKPKSKSRAK